MKNIWLILYICTAEYTSQYFPGLVGGALCGNIRRRDRCTRDQMLSLQNLQPVCSGPRSSLWMESNQGDLHQSGQQSWYHVSNSYLYYTHWRIFTHPNSLISLRFGCQRFISGVVISLSCTSSESLESTNSTVWWPVRWLTGCRFYSSGFKTWRTAMWKKFVSNKPGPGPKPVETQVTSC